MSLDFDKLLYKGRSKKGFLSFNWGLSCFWSEDFRSQRNNSKPADHGFRDLHLSCQCARPRLGQILIAARAENEAIVRGHKKLRLLMKPLTTFADGNRFVKELFLDDAMATTELPWSHYSIAMKSPWNRHGSKLRHSNAVKPCLDCLHRSVWSAIREAERKWRNSFTDWWKMIQRCRAAISVKFYLASLVMKMTNWGSYRSMHLFNVYSAEFLTRF